VSGTIETASTAAAPGASTPVAGFTEYCFGAVVLTLNAMHSSDGFCAQSGAAGVVRLAYAWRVLHSWCCVTQGGVASRISSGPPNLSE
jgi:hypothetical protein